MDRKHYQILKYLNDNPAPVHFDKFPNEITCQYLHGTKAGSLRHELEITLKNKGWINTPRYVNGPFSLSEEGKAAFEKQEIKEDDQFLKMNPKLLEARNAILVYLADPTRRNSYSNIEDICNDLDIAEEMINWLKKHLYQNAFVSGPTLARSSEMIISENGIEEVDKIENEYFISKRRPMAPRNSYEATIDEACEYLFQMHKKNKFRLEWTKSIYDNAPDNLDAAKDLMLAQNILKEGRDWQDTKLNPELYEINSYKEAKAFLQNRSNVPGSSTHNYHVQQAGAVGPYSIAHDNTFNQINHQLPADTNFEELKTKLEELRKALAGEADQEGDYAALGYLKKAEIAATEKNGAKVIEYIRMGGKWIFEKGTDIGKEVLVAYIKSLTGIG